LAKTTAPLLSFDARGQVAKTQVYASWRGQPYVRRYTVPAYTNTSEQVLTRSAFSWLQAVFKVAPGLVTDPWTQYIKGKKLTARNAFTKFNLPVLRTETDLLLFNFSPGALGGPPPATLVITPGANQLSCAITAPSPAPTGWTVYSAVAACILDQDPQSAIDYETTAAEDLSDPYACVLTGLASGTYQVGGWLLWTRPDGKIAYSPAIHDQAIVA